MPRRQTILVIFRVALCGLSFLILSNAVFSQTSRRRIKAPATMLNDLDEEDRQCVVNEGGLNKHVRVAPFNVTRATRGEILVRGSSSCLCGAQNCGFWIYGRTGSRYELLLKGIGATKVQLGRGYSLGYRDVIAESHASAIETIVRTYQFDGRHYRMERCISRDYYDENGNQITKPRYRPCETESKSESYVTLPPGILDRELTTIDNKHLKLSDYSHRIIVLNLFASWCRPCVINLIDLVKLGKRYKTHPIQILGVVWNQNNRELTTVREFARAQRLNFPIIWDDRDFSESIVKLVNGGGIIPQTFVIDESGRIRKHFRGYSPEKTLPRLRDALDQVGEEMESQKPRKSP